MIRFILNDTTIETRMPAGMVLLDFIRYHQHLFGTKIGCREGDCGACTVLIGTLSADSVHYQSMTSCLMPLGNANGKHIVTVEGINFPSGLNPIQQAMADEGATQCGFCTPGFVVSLAGYCLNGKDHAIAAIDGNICRCTGYKSIERAAKKIETLLMEKKGEDSISFVTSSKILPAYFSEIKNKLSLLVKTKFSDETKALENKGSQLQTINYKPQTILGGGTDFYVQRPEELVDASISFYFDRPEFNGINKLSDQIIIGASITVTDLKNSEVFNNAIPDFQRFAKLVSSTPIRNMATLAGNFVNASPIGDMTIFFLALNANITLQSELTREGNGNNRVIPLKKFYLGYKKLDKRPDEYISEISFQIPGNHYHFNFEKVSKRTHLDIASVNTALGFNLVNNRFENVCLSAGGVGPVPLYLEKTSAFLDNKELNETLVDEAIEIAKTEISPISDARGAKEYKTLLLGQLIKAHFIQLKLA